MEFNFPSAPTHLVFPHTAHLAANAYIWAAAGILALLALRELYTTRSPLGLVLMAGGALAYFNEPVDDILGLVWHPRIHQDTVLNTIGPIPMWGLPTYIVFFGGDPVAAPARAAPRPVHDQEVLDRRADHVRRRPADRDPAAADEAVRLLRARPRRR